jgi:hypothetical protein
MKRYYGWYASRTRGTRARLASDCRRLTADGLSVEGPVAITEAVNWSLRAARYRWAELLRRIFEVYPLACPQCAAPMRIVAVITDPAVFTRILVHRARGLERTLLPAPGSLLPAPCFRRAASVARSRSAPLPPPAPGPRGVPAAHRQSLGARFSPEPGPRRPRTPPTHPGPAPAQRPAASPTRCVIDAPTTRPDIRIGGSQFLLEASSYPSRSPGGHASAAVHSARIGAAGT